MDMSSEDLETFVCILPSVMFKARMPNWMLVRQ